MHEPISERLSQFTPDGSGLDRDALLIAAGRASARPNRVWRAATALLAGSQIITLILLWPHPLPPTVSIAEQSPVPALSLPMSSDNTDDRLAADTVLGARDYELPPLARVDRIVRDDPPLSVRASPAVVPLP